MSSGGALSSESAQPSGSEWLSLGHHPDPKALDRGKQLRPQIARGVAQSESTAFDVRLQRCDRFTIHGKAGN
jgi:hypothetical protein